LPDLDLEIEHNKHIMKKTTTIYSIGRRQLLGGGLSILAMSALSACGFRLRGKVDLPYKNILISGSLSQELRDDLDMMLRVNDIQIVKTAKDAELILEIISEQNARQVLSYNGAGQITAYRIISRIVFRAFDPIGNEIMPESDIYLTRDIDFKQSDVQSFDLLVAEYLKGMRIDLVSQLMRRLASIKKLPSQQTPSESQPKSR
jgi:LPS-assembly lipoprotein